MKQGILEKTRIYFKEVIVEGKKVNWPTRKEALRYTLIVIGISLVVSLFLWSIDMIVTKLLQMFVIR